MSPGGMVTLTCGLSSGSVTTSNDPKWQEQNPGQASLLLIYSTNSHPSGVPACYPGSISGNKAALTITRAQSEDEIATVLHIMAVGAAIIPTVVQMMGK